MFERRARRLDSESKAAKIKWALEKAELQVYREYFL
jgi:hypothetical protein